MSVRHIPRCMLPPPPPPPPAPQHSAHVSPPLPPETVSLFFVPFTLFPPSCVALSVSLSSRPAAGGGDLPSFGALLFLFSE